MTVAQTILQQLGGYRFFAMTGAKNLINAGNGLRFDLPASLTKQRANKFSVLYCSETDSYTLVLAKYRNLDYKVLETVEGIYVDNLRQTFTRMTGLDTHL